jgi:hypothetical protein
MRHGLSAIVAAVLAGAWTGPAHADEPAALPDALPPLDDTLAAAAPDPVRFFAGARLRAELEGARTFSRGDEAGVGASVAGLAGVEALLGDAASGARLVVSFAESGRLGPPTARPLLVAAPPLAPLHQAQLALQTRLFGLPAELSVGRGAVALADERLLGTEPLELRPRTLDGASARVRADTVELGAGAWWLGGHGDDLDAVGALDTALHLGDDASLQAWALAERAGLSALWLPTLGARALGRVGWVEGRAAAELQAPHAVATLEREGVAGRASAGGRITLDGSELALPLPRVFADLDGELVAGDAVAGRVLHAPAPTRHGVRGALDLLAPRQHLVHGPHAGPRGGAPERVDPRPPGGHGRPRRPAPRSPGRSHRGPSQRGRGARAPGARCGGSAPSSRPTSRSASPGPRRRPGPALLEALHRAT